MQVSKTNLEQKLLETSAGRAVYDSLVQANVNVRTVPLEVVKRMLIAECRYRRLYSFDDRTAATLVAG